MLKRMYSVKTAPGLIRYDVRVLVGDHRGVDGYLTSNLLDPSKGRNIVLLHERLIPSRILSENEREITMLRQQQVGARMFGNLGDVSAQKRLCLDIAKKRIQPVTGTKVANYFLGPVPVYRLGKDLTGNYEICVYLQCNEHATDVDMNKGLTTRVESYLEFGLREILTQYIEDSVACLETVFKTSPHDQAIRFARKAQAILGRSYDTKVNEIRALGKSEWPRDRELSNIIERNHLEEITVLRFARNLILLLINELYGFFGLPQRIKMYEDRLDKLAQNLSNVGSETTARILVMAYNQFRKGEEIKQAEDLTSENWVKTLVWVTRRVQVVKEVMGGGLSFINLNVFVSHDMKNPSSLRFVEWLRTYLSESMPFVKVITGSGTDDKQIGEMIETKIWACDVFLQHIPVAFYDTEFNEIPMERETWIGRELVDARILDKPFRIIREKPYKFDLMELFKVWEKQWERSTSKDSNFLEPFEETKREALEDLRKKLVEQAWIVYHPGRTYDEALKEKIRDEFREHGKRKCATTIPRIVRCRFDLNTYRPLSYIHRQSKTGNRYVDLDEVCAMLTKDKVEPFAHLEMKQARNKFLNSYLARYRRMVFNTGDELIPLVETLKQGRKIKGVRSRLYEIALSFANRYKVNVDITGEIDSEVERGQLNADII